LFLARVLVLLTFTEFLVVLGAKLYHIWVYFHQRASGRCPLNLLCFAVYGQYIFYGKRVSPVVCTSRDNSLTVSTNTVKLRFSGAEDSSLLLHNLLLLCCQSSFFLGIPSDYVVVPSDFN